MTEHEQTERLAAFINAETQKALEQFASNLANTLFEERSYTKEELVMSQTEITEELARKALVESNGDIVKAIIKLQESK